MNTVKRLVAVIVLIGILVLGNTNIYADTTTGLVGQYMFDGDIKNAVNGKDAEVTGQTVCMDGGDKKPIFTEGVNENAILFNGSASGYGLELKDCILNDNEFTISYDIYYTMYSQSGATIIMQMSEGEFKDEIYDDAWIEFGVGTGRNLAYAAGIEIYEYISDPLSGTGTTVKMVVLDDPLYELTDGTGEYNWRTKWIKWTNITYVISGEDYNVYVDGKKIPIHIEYSEDKMNKVDADTRIFLGTCERGAPILAAIDNLYIYDRALTEADIKELIDERNYTSDFVLPEGVVVSEEKDYDVVWGFEEATSDVQGETETETSKRNNNSHKDNVVKNDNKKNTKDVSDEENVIFGKANKIIIKIAIVTMVIVLLIVIFGFVNIKGKVKKHTNDKNNNEPGRIPTNRSGIVVKIFNARNFLVLIFSVFVVCMLVMKIRHDMRQDNIKKNIEEYVSADNEREEASTSVSEEVNPRYNTTIVKDIRVLESTPELCCDMDNVTSVGKALKEADITVDGIHGVMIGVDKDGEGIERYYITDKEVIEKVVNKLEEMKLTKMTNIGEDTYKVEPDWDIQLCRLDSEYGFRIYGEPTDAGTCFRTMVDEVYNEGYYAAKDQSNNAYENVFGSFNQILFDSDIIDFLTNIIEDNIEEIDMETAINIGIAEELDREKLFGYKHTAPVYEGMAAYIVEFPIKESDCYLLVKKQCSVRNFKPMAQVEQMELYNGEGEAIDMFNATEEEIREFIEQ